MQLDYPVIMLSYVGRIKLKSSLNGDTVAPPPAKWKRPQADACPVARCHRGIFRPLARRRARRLRRGCPRHRVHGRRDPLRSNQHRGFGHAAADGCLRPPALAPGGGQDFRRAQDVEAITALRRSLGRVRCRALDPARVCFRFGWAGARCALGQALGHGKA